MKLKPMAVYNPGQVFSNDPPALGELGYRFLAEGDSWFSIGTLNPAKNSNLLFEMAFKQSAGTVNCASPGDTLRRMSNMSKDPNFADLLRGRRARIWDALLLSCGGNDLIDALAVRGDAPIDKRLVLNQPEWGAESLGPARYLSDPGWQTFCTYMRANLEHLVGLRDAGPSKGVPMFLHGYAYPTPRPSGAGASLGPWIHPCVQNYAIPEADLIPLARLLIRRLADLLAGCAADKARFPSLHFFDSALVPMEPAALGATGESGDWVNEIHLTWRGYEKIALPWSAAIEDVLSQR
jgi:hypothetical protein